jgi:hypothetical protein
MEQRLGSSSQDVLPSPVRGGHALTTDERSRVDLSSHIKGWGSDLDPAVRPGVPRDNAPDIGVESLYPPIEQQPRRFKIHKSTEHGRFTPVFGTSCPPAGISGGIRDIAYRYSEGRLARWLLLIVADRVNVAEDILKDLVRLRVPNIPKEMGIKAELQHNPVRFALKVAIVGLCIGAVLRRSRARRVRYR